jgi:hypothetical protein
MLASLLQDDQHVSTTTGSTSTISSSEGKAASTTKRKASKPVPSASLGKDPDKNVEIEDTLSIPQQELDTVQLPDYGHFFYYDVAQGHSRILSKFGTPKRTAHDHPYAQCGDKRKSSAGMAKKNVDCEANLERDSSSSATACEATFQMSEAESVSDLSDIEYLSNLSSTDADKDHDYVPSDTTDTECSDGEVTSQDEVHKMLNEKKYIIFQSNLEELMKFCQKCGSPISSKTSTNKGSMVAYKITCLAGCDYTWQSQPMISPQLPCGNLLLSAGILITGNSYSSIKAFADATNIQVISKQAHQQHQHNSLTPVIQDEWRKARQKVVEELKTKDTYVLAGDARMDSPGHNAKYGSYTLMDTDGNGCEGNRKIVSMEMVQVSEVSGPLIHISWNTTPDSHKYRENRELPIFVSSHTIYCS